MDENVPTKKCSTCKVVKPVTKFNVNAKSKDGYNCQCKHCVKIANSKNPSKVKEYIEKNMWGLTGRDY